MFRVCLLLIGLTQSSIIDAQCNFKTSQYLSEIGRANSIRNIEINVPKSAKYMRNIFKTLVSEYSSLPIPSNLKNNYRAELKINYWFGSCRYEAKIKQHGDLRDHIKLLKGGLVSRSLRVKLKEGNLLNSVDFKLLLPETRNNLNEVLGTILMKQMGFIAPETFQIETIINGHQSIMLFQESATKELLERHGRREGPLFKGDEDILWTPAGFNHKLQPLSFSQMSNPDWFLKTDNSQDISLDAFATLQRAYLHDSFNYQDKTDQLRDLSALNSDNMRNYFYVLVAMNGAHGLAVNNRNYFYNSFLSGIEPIYYDGNLTLQKEVALKDSDTKELLMNKFGPNYRFPYKELLSNSEFNNEVFDKFKSRVKINDDEAAQFFSRSMRQLQQNIASIENIAKQNSSSNYNLSNSKSAFEKYYATQESLNFQQKTIISLKKVNDIFEAIDSDENQLSLTSEQVLSLIADNILFGERYVFLPYKSSSNSTLRQRYKNYPFLNGSISQSLGISIDIDHSSRLITIMQSSAEDWILFNHINLAGWQLKFDGLENSGTQSFKTKRRFNEYGMTGCLNLYKSTFDDTTIHAKNGACEDTVNIVNSIGSLNMIKISNSVSDALDIDFSELDIKLVEITQAGNDCVDLSAGIYSVNQMNLTDCADKGVSIGEKSLFNAHSISIDGSLIGVSSKDLSETVINETNFRETTVCYQAMQKKQEFGGAMLKVSLSDCTGGNQLDQNSSIIVGVNELP